MASFILVVFVLGYLAIALEHPLRIDKAASALITGVVCWLLYFMSGGSPAMVESAAAVAREGVQPDIHALLEGRLMYHLQEISAILLFLMGAMTIVELIDAHDGFRVITDKITARRKVSLLWIIAWVTFFLSAALDNLTTAIVMVSLARKLIADQKTRWFFGGIIIIAANAGGAWSPIGDVTTTMLWIGGQVTTSLLIQHVFPASFIALLVPLIGMSFVLRGDIQRPDTGDRPMSEASRRDKNLVFIAGITSLLMVPVIKNTTHLPPFMGMMLSLGVLWLLTELIHSKKIMEEKSRFTALNALRKIDMPSVLFFLGILLAVSSLAEVGLLRAWSASLRSALGNVFLIDGAIGLLSSVVDNVPLVAAAKEMYAITPISTGDAWADYFVCDGLFWQFLAFTAGTGGSILIIGSAAGVAVMGIERISFGWYLRRIAPWALLGYVAGGLAFVLQNA